MNNRLIEIFENANDIFLQKDIELLDSKVSERTLCGALMLHLNNIIKETEFAEYKVDVEYNRNTNGTVKTIIKTIEGPNEVKIKINCDLIVHSRGNNFKRDNLIAIEMKKSNAKRQAKENDKTRLKALTKDIDNDIYPDDGKTFPEDVCGYGLGIYYEVNYKKRIIDIEYYENGYSFDYKQINF